MIDDLAAGPYLDRLIAEKVMGWKPRNEQNHRWWYGNGAEDGRHIAGNVDVWTGDHRLLSFRPSTNIAHAWEVVEALASRRRAHLVVFPLCEEYGKAWVSADFAQQDHGDYWVDGNWTGRVEAETAPLAICRAALKAVS